MSRFQLRTVRGYAFGEVSSAMQKAIRRADTQLAGYWFNELLSIFPPGLSGTQWHAGEVPAMTAAPCAKHCQYATRR